MIVGRETERRGGLLGMVLVLGLLSSFGPGRARALAGGSEPTRAAVEAGDPAAVEFFEKSVRPILATRCQGCHGPDKPKGKLRLDSRASILAGGATGPAVVPGKPEESLLVDAINYGETYQMPPKSKLPDEEIATLTRWVKLGAPWGVETKARSIAEPSGRWYKRWASPSPS